MIEEWKLARDTWPNYTPTGNVPEVNVETYQIFNRTLNDATNRARLYGTVNFVGADNNLFIFTFTGSLQEARDDLLYLEGYWGNNFIIQGAWWFDGEPASACADPQNARAGKALHAGMSYTYDAQDPPMITGVSGTPTEPLNANLYQFMPPINTYDENGDLISSIPPTSNADLRDINLIAGQTPRMFT